VSSVERTAVRFAGYGAYVLGVFGLAFALPYPWGWALCIVAGLIPGGYLLAKDVERRADLGEARRFAAPQHQASNGGPAPTPLLPPAP
jgi:hypothetical protein